MTNFIKYTCIYVCVFVCLTVCLSVYDKRDDFNFDIPFPFLSSKIIQSPAYGDLNLLVMPAPFRCMRTLYFGYRHYH